jgi:hypothetical protein
LLFSIDEVWTCVPSDNFNVGWKLSFDVLTNAQTMPSTIFLSIASINDCKSLLLLSVVVMKRVPKVTYRTRSCPFIKSESSSESGGYSSDNIGPIS